MGKEPIGSKVTIPGSGTRGCLGPLFRLNQPSKISAPVTARAGQDEQEGFPQPGLGANYLFELPANTCQLGTVFCKYLSSWEGTGAAGPRWGSPVLPRAKTAPQITSAAPSFHPPSLPLTCKNCLTDPKDEGEGTTSKSLCILIPLQSIKIYRLFLPRARIHRGC